VPVLIALSHDILITSGVYALLGREVTTSTVAALLTILGYSLYDTIIVFDRIRENVPRMPRATFSQIVNRSMSEVLTRSLATSFSTLLPVSALMLFGGETLRDFAFALLVGIASGAYSSIFIAAPVLTLWKEREPVYVRRRKMVLEETGGTVPPFSTGSLGDGGAPEPDSGDGRGGGGRRGGRKAPPVPAPPEPALAGGRASKPEPATTTRQAAAQKRAPAPAAPAPTPPPEPKDVPSGDGGEEAPRSSSSSTAGGGSSSKPKPKKSTSRPRKKHGRR
jgi:SecD/SecF fusion protein